MVALNFPDSPSEGDIFTSGDRSWKYTGGVWVVNPVANAFAVNIDGGIPSSTYAGGISSVDGGGP
jgi:hypothetical protein